MKRILCALSVLVCSGAVYADQGFGCSRDGRPVDGIYEQVILATNLNGTFDVLYTRQSSHDEEPNQVVLAKSLACVTSKKDARVVSCSRAGTRVENSSSGLESKKVTEKGVSAVSTGESVDAVRAADWIKKLVVLSIYSPEVRELFGPKLRKEFRFELNQCRSLN